MVSWKNGAALRLSDIAASVATVVQDQLKLAGLTYNQRVAAHHLPAAGMPTYSGNRRAREGTVAAAAPYSCRRLT